MPCPITVSMMLLHQMSCGSSISPVRLLTLLVFSQSSGVDMLSSGVRIKPYLFWYAVDYHCYITPFLSSHPTFKARNKYLIITQRGVSHSTFDLVFLLARVLSSVCIAMSPLRVSQSSVLSRHRRNHLGNFCILLSTDSKNNLVILPTSISFPMYTRIYI